jgi:hypothetical protein
MLYETLKLYFSFAPLFLVEKLIQPIACKRIRSFAKKDRAHVELQKVNKSKNDLLLFCKTVKQCSLTLFIPMEKNIL